MRPSAVLFVLALSACAHTEAAGPAQGEAPRKAASKESRASEAIRTRAAFDLGCPAEQVQISEIESGNFVRPATYGAACGDKRAAYLERMGTIIRQ